MNCTSINFEGKEIKFSSDMELDLFLESIRDKHHIVADASLSVDLVRTTEERINAISDKVSSLEVEEHRINDDGDVETYYKIPGSIGTTRFAQTYTIPGGTKPLVTPFDEKQYFDKRRAELKAEGQTDAEIDAYFKELKSLWKMLTDYGTEVHKVYELTIKGEVVNPSDFKLLPEHIIQGVARQCSEFMEHLRNKHGQNCKFLTEVPLISTDLNEIYKTSIDSINGRADLIVIDESGVAHIYDFKVSRKEVGEWNVTDNRVIKDNKW